MRNLKIGKKLGKKRTENKKVQKSDEESGRLCSMVTYRLKD